jgi:hypothetical protein
MTHGIIVLYCQDRYGKQGIYKNICNKYIDLDIFQTRLFLPVRKMFLKKFFTLTRTALLFLNYYTTLTTLPKLLYYFSGPIIV